LPATVIDADGLNCLAARDDWPQRLPPACVLTPHPAEMARLCGLSVAEVMADRWELARRMATTWQCIVLLKGPYTVIAAPSGELAVLPVATPALASAGSGDVLAGVIGGLLAQGIDALCGSLHRRVAARHGRRDVRGGDRRRRRGCLRSVDGAAARTATLTPRNIHF
jgi:hydroxyethylthiazole kinase-like uncharacterized protein yjeF